MNTHQWYQLLPKSWGKKRGLIISQSADWLTSILFITHWHPYISLDLFMTNIILAFFLQPTHIHKHQILKYQIFPNPSIFIQFSCWCFEPFAFQKNTPQEKSNRRKRSQKSVKTKLGGQHNRDRNGGEIFGCPKKHPEKHQFEEVWKNPYKINKHLLRLKVIRGEANSHLLPHQVYVWRNCEALRGWGIQSGPHNSTWKKQWNQSIRALIRITKRIFIFFVNHSILLNWIFLTLINSKGISFIFNDKLLNINEWRFIAFVFSGERFLGQTQVFWANPWRSGMNHAIFRIIIDLVGGFNPSEKY